jgi:hypothetical protein
MVRTVNAFLIAVWLLFAVEANAITGNDWRRLPNRLRWFLLIMIAGVAFLAISDLGKIASDSYRRWISDPRVIRDYLESHSVRKLQLGAGGNDPIGWLNTDIVPTRDEVYLDATQRYPFPDGSFQYVFSEHINHWESMAFEAVR